MNEVEKMYENAGINKREIENCTYKNSTSCGHFCDDGEDCPYLEIKNDYPPFTAEKQLELIKWLTKYDEIYINYNNDKYNINTLNYYGDYKKDFKEALASAINDELWQDLTEEERKQIGDILE